MRMLELISITVLAVFLTSNCSKRASESEDNGEMITFESMGKSLEEIISMLDSSGKPGFLYFTTEWCSWCKVLRSDVFKNPEVKNFVETNFIPFIIDAEKSTGPELKAKYLIRGYPTVAVINKNGEVIDKIIGEYKAEPYLDRLRNIIGGEKTYLSLKKQYEANPENEETAFHLAVKMVKNYEHNEAKPIFEKLINSIRNKEYLPEIYFHLGDIYNREANAGKAIAFWEKVRNDFPNFINISDVYLNLGRGYFYGTSEKEKGILLLEEGLIKNVFKENLDNVYYTLVNMNFEIEDYNRAIKFIKLIPQDSRYYVNTQSVLGVYYFKTGEDSEGEKHLENLYLKIKNNPEDVNTLASTCAANGVNLKNAEKWMANVVGLEEGKKYYIYYNYARILYDNGKIKKAVEIQKKAVEAAGKPATKENYKKKLREYEAAMKS